MPQLAPFLLVASLALPAAPADTLTRFQRDKAEALLRDQLACLGCHALGAAGGGRLGPDLADVGRRRSAAYVAAMIEAPERVVPGTSMPRVAMPAATRALVARYLVERTPPAARAPAAPAPPLTSATRAAPAPDTSGARLYARYCAACHGAGGAGDGPNARHLPARPAAHASRAEMAGRTDDRLYDAIAAGGGPLGRSPRMPAFGGTLAPAQTWALVRHIRALCRCEGPAWSTDGTGENGGAPRRAPGPR